MEQLELHEIVKAKLLEKLTHDEKNIASMIWRKCSNMNSYLQMNFDVKIREHLFTSNTQSNKQTKYENERFESPISFPNFLLQVNATNAIANEDSSLDDRNLIENLKDNRASAENAKTFLSTKPCRGRTLERNRAVRKT